MEGLSSIEIDCLHNQKESCFNSIAVNGLLGEIEKSKSLMGEDPEVDEIALEDIRAHQEALEQTCRYCSLWQASVSSRTEDTKAGIKILPTKGSMTTQEMLRFVRKNGCVVTEGHGRHGLHIVTSTGSKIPLPAHKGKDLSSGVYRKIIRQVAN